MGTNDWWKYWAAYMPAFEAWHAFMLSTAVDFSRASMLWMMVPLEVGQKVRDEHKSGDAGSHLETLLRHTRDAQKRAETFATGAYASSLDAGRRSFHEIEAATLDRGTVDLGLVEAGRARGARDFDA